MISEELVASGGTQVHEADIPERSPKATDAQESRVSVVPYCSQGSEDLPWYFLPREAAGKLGVLEKWAQVTASSAQASSHLPGPFPAISTHGRVWSSL